MKTNTAVLHLKSKEPQKVYQLAGKVNTNMVANAQIFPTPNPTMVEFSAETTKLDTFIKAKDGSKPKNQAILDQADVVYMMLKSLLTYVNTVADGEKAIILLSGFDCNNEPTEHDIPGKALIRRVEDGSIACSVKIYAEPIAGADRYKVEISTSLSAPEWKTVIDFGALNKLVIMNLIRGQEIFIRITAGNRHGWGDHSEPVAFIPR
jgi:hypothetical protein